MFYGPRQRYCNGEKVIMDISACRDQNLFDDKKMVDDAQLTIFRSKTRSVKCYRSNRIIL